MDLWSLIFGLVSGSDKLLNELEIAVDRSDLPRSLDAITDFYLRYGTTIKTGEIHNHRFNSILLRAHFDVPVVRSGRDFFCSNCGRETEHTLVQAETGLPAPMGPAFDLAISNTDQILIEEWRCNICASELLRKYIFSLTPEGNRNWVAFNLHRAVDHGERGEWIGDWLQKIIKSVRAL